MRQSLPDHVARTVACSIVGSRLDYCNSLFVGMTDCNFKKLQRVQNALARVVLRVGKFEHITPALIKLHWLPVKQRVLCKQALITFNVFIVRLELIQTKIGLKVASPDIEVIR